MDSISSERKSKKSTIDKAKKNLENLKKRLKIVKEQERISPKLLEAEATNRLRHLELLRELSDVEAKIDEQGSIISTISKTDLDRVNNNYSQQLNSELSELQREKTELEKRIRKYSDNLKRTVLKSPVSGIVKSISVNSKGAIVAPGVTVAEIVPEEELIIEANLPLSEIGYVRKGLDTKIRLNTPEGSRFQAINGKVIYVGLIEYLQKMRIII